MAPKKITGYVKLQIVAAKATPAPPVGPALGQAQVNIMEFCKQFNARTQNKEMEGLVIPVVITVYADRTFSFVTKTPPAAVLLLKAAGGLTREFEKALRFGGPSYLIPIRSLVAAKLFFEDSRRPDFGIEAGPV